MTMVSGDKVVESDGGTISNRLRKVKYEKVKIIS